MNSGLISAMLKSIRCLCMFCAVLFSIPFTAAELPDSLLKEERVYELSSVHPDSARAIIQTMRERELLEPWHLDYIEATCYANNRQYRKSRNLYDKILESGALDYLPEYKKRVLARLVILNDHLLDDDNLTSSAYSLERIATETHDDYFLAIARFLLGKRRQFQGDSTGIDNCLEAVDQLRKSNRVSKNNILTHFYADLMRMYAIDNHFDEAYHMSVLQEETAKNVAAQSVSQLDCNSLRIAYALRACLFSTMGRMEDAERSYEQWKQTPFPNPSDDKFILDYLMASNRFDEADSVLTSYKAFLLQEGDSISHWMLYALSLEYIITDFRGDNTNAARLNNEMYMITNQLHKRRSKEVMENTYTLMEEQEKSYNRKLLLSIGTVFILFLLAVLIAVVYYNRKLHSRNKILVSLINSLDAYRFMLGKDKDQDNTSPTLSKLIEKIHAGMPPAEAVSEMKKEEMEEKEEKAEIDLADLHRYKVSEDDKQLFVLMDRLVARDQLFLNPNLSREDLMNLLGIDKNRFGKMMSRYSSTSNVSSYISAKRAEYAAELLVKHPEFTIAAIAEMSGMSNTVTLNRTFRTLYGVTPSEYRNNLNANNNGGEQLKV